MSFWVDHYHGIQHVSIMPGGRGDGSGWAAAGQDVITVTVTGGEGFLRAKHDPVCFVFLYF